MDTYKRSIRGLQSRSNGEHFEGMIIAASRFYEERGIAAVDKTPEAFKVLKAMDRNRLYQFKQELLSNKDRAWYSHTNLLTAVDLLITDLDNLDESDWIRVNDEMPVERDSMFAKFKGTNKWKTGMFEKVSRNVLVTVEYDNGERHTEVAHTVDGRWKLEMRILNAKVIAWKEKPQPYKGDKNVSNM